MRKAFTLVEVLVSAGIISIVGIALLQSHSTNTKLINRMNKQYHVKEEFSLILLNANENYSGSSKSIYDFISQKFTIKNDELKKWLKDKSIEYKDKEFSNIKLLDTDIEELIGTAEGLEENNLPDLAFSINKVNAISDTSNIQGFTVKLQ